MGFKKSTNAFETKNQRACKLELAQCFLINFTYAKCKVTFFIKLFLISLILYEGSTLLNFDFLIKKDFWYVVFILDFKHARTPTHTSRTHMDTFSKSVFSKFHIILSVLTWKFWKKKIFLEKKIPL